MKPILVFAAVFLCATVFAQPAFEGVIRYSVSSSLVLHGSVQKEEGQMSIYFGKNKIRVEMTSPQRTTSPAYIVINLDSGKVYNLEPEDNSYTSRRLTRLDPTANEQQTKTIAGYTTRKTQLKSLSHTGLLNDLLSSKTVFQVADGLRYSVPPQYESNTELLMVQNGRIVLGANFYVSPYSWGQVFDEEEESKIDESNFVAVEATEVKEEPVDDSLFQIPSHYRRRKQFEYSSADSTALLDSLAMIDSMISESAKQPPQKKKKKAPANKPKTAPKSPALRRKNG